MLQKLENDVKEMLGRLLVSLGRASNSFGNIGLVTRESLFDLDFAASVQRTLRSASAAHPIKVTSISSHKDRIYLRRPSRPLHFSLARRRRTIHSTFRPTGH
jgi:hypothetical protein